MKKNVNQFMTYVNLGLKPKEMLRDMGYKNVAVYFNAEYDVAELSGEKALPVLSAFYHDLVTPVNVNYISNSHKPTYTFFVPDMFGLLSVSRDAVYKPGYELLIVLSNDELLPIIGKAKKDGTEIWNFTQLIAYATSYLFYIKPLMEQSRKRNFSTVFLQTSVLPGLEKNVSVLSENEKFIHENKLINNFSAIRKAAEDAENPRILGAGFAGAPYSTPAGIASILTNPGSTISADGVIIYNDRESEFVNYKDGRRVTVGNNENPNRNVFVTGACNIIGIGLSDTDTLPSQIQSILNDESSGIGESVSVHNYANFLHSRLFAMPTQIAHIPVGDNDVIVVVVDSRLINKARIEKFNLKNWQYIDCGTIFKRPHNYGEVYFDNWHNNFRGMRVYAEKVVECLRGHDYFRNPETTKTEIDSSQEKSRIIPELADWLKSLKVHKTPIGSIVMNCNPFTLGHRYLIEYAASRVTHLYIFAVEEDRSVFPFADRFELIKQGTADLQNVTVLPSGKFIISQTTFSDYFNKSEIQDKEIDPSQDVEIFAAHIAPALGITVRFAGEEPLDNVTNQYNDAMNRILPRFGIDFVEIPRKAHGGGVISASRVRKLLETRDWGAIAQLVPQTTLDYLQNLKS